MEVTKIQLTNTMVCIDLFFLIFKFSTRKFHLKYGTDEIIIMRLSFFVIGLVKVQVPKSGPIEICLQNDSRKQMRSLSGYFIVTLVWIHKSRIAFYRNKVQVLQPIQISLMKMNPTISLRNSVP